MEKFDSVEKVLETHLPAEELEFVKSVVYGQGPVALEIPQDASKMAEEHDFEIKSFKIPAKPEQVRAPRLVRIAAIQNKLVLPAGAPIPEQVQAMQDRMKILVEAAVKAGANVIGLQECWHVPFFMCTREKDPWCQYAEPPTGPSTRMLQELARQHNVVIIAPILRRDEAHGDTVHNTAMVISNNGAIIGMHDKNHIPRVGDFNEANYYVEGMDGHPVFETVFGKIGINICYGRHHPLNWMAFGLNGAEIVFNPSATVGALSEPLWPLEARTAAIANGYFSVAINRVGTETFPNAFTSGNGLPQHNDFGHFYGASYIAAPSGCRTEGLTRLRDGVLVTEVDLNMCRQVKDVWCFQMTGRHEVYADFLAKYTRADFQPQIIRDPALNE
eukprot:gnl/Trimastix_PCT/518.p2 GENE.gnl/Trimastix_PCT/518~~gnl/Trimastix_PCT/518.p2  ORF type:complete len:387 (-),score=147.96 gnl/Trimastix_PCT/518:86-1246(-)